MISTSKDFPRIIAHHLAAGGAIPKKLSSRGVLGIVGAYPAGQRPDMCTPLRPSLEQRAAAIARVALPPRDPVYGEGGPLFTHWK